MRVRSRQGRKDWTTGRPGLAARISRPRPPGSTSIGARTRPVHLSPVPAHPAATAHGGHLANPASLRRVSREHTPQCRPRPPTTTAVPRAAVVVMLIARSLQDVVEVRNTGGAPLELWQNGDWSVPWEQWEAGTGPRPTRRPGRFVSVAGALMRPRGAKEPRRAPPFAQRSSSAMQSPPLLVNPSQVHGHRHCVTRPVSHTVLPDTGPGYVVTGVCPRW